MNRNSDAYLAIFFDILVERLNKEICLLNYIQRQRYDESMMIISLMMMIAAKMHQMTVII